MRGSMALFIDVPRKSLQTVTTQVMADLIDVATALGINSQTCSIHLLEKTPDISSVRRLIDWLVRDANEIVSSIEMLQRLMVSEAIALGCEFCSTTGPASQLPCTYDHSADDMGGEK
jgi:lipopolysaccharide biosynthesis regulator YciM